MRAMFSKDKRRERSCRPMRFIAGDGDGIETGRLYEMIPFSCRNLFSPSLCILPYSLAILFVGPVEGAVEPAVDGDECPFGN